MSGIIPKSPIVVTLCCTFARSLFSFSAYPLDSVKVEFNSVTKCLCLSSRRSCPHVGHLASLANSKSFSVFSTCVSALVKESSWNAFSFSKPFNVFTSSVCFASFLCAFSSFVISTFSSSTIAFENPCSSSSFCVCHALLLNFNDSIDSCILSFDASCESSFIFSSAISVLFAFCCSLSKSAFWPVSYTHLRAHET